MISRRISWITVFFLLCFKGALAQTDLDLVVARQSVVNSQRVIAEIATTKDSVAKSVDSGVDEMTNKVRVTALRNLSSQRSAVVSLSDQLESSTDAMRAQKAGIQNKIGELGRALASLSNDDGYDAASLEDENIRLEAYKAKIDEAKLREPTESSLPTEKTAFLTTIKEIANAIQSDPNVRVGFSDAMLNDLDVGEISTEIDAAIVEIETEINKIEVAAQSIRNRTAEIDPVLQDILRQIDTADGSRSTLSSLLAQLDTYGTTLLQAKLDSSDYTSNATYVFGGLVAVVIIGFFGVAFTTPDVRTVMFSGDRGIQFITLFSLVIAIILFGILGILEGKELSALLGGLSGYILGRGSNLSTENATAGSKPGGGV